MAEHVRADDLDAPLIFDSSALFNFGHRGNLAQVLAQFGQRHALLIPPEVQSEVMIDATFDYAAFIAQHFKVQSGALARFNVAALARISADLGAGELAVLALADSVSGQAVIDELAGRRVAHEIGLPVIGTLGLLQKAWSQGWLSDADALTSVRLMRVNGFRCSRVSENDTFAEYLSRIK